MRRSPAFAFALALSFSAGAGAQQGSWRAERTRVGDTLVVRTVSGSVWRDTMTLVPEVAIGSADGDDPFLFGRYLAMDVDAAGRIYVLDLQANEGRVFSPSGQFLFKFGRRGSGPGEFQNPTAIRVTPDGRAIVRDNQARIAMFSPTGVYTGGWLLKNGFGTTEPFYLTSDGRVLNPTFLDRLVWYKLDGTPLDTLRRPQRGAAEQKAETRGGPTGGHASYSIGYMPGTRWTLSAEGRFIIGRNDTYQFDVTQADGSILRIARNVSPVPVARGEAQQIRESTTRNIRRNNDPNWTWTGSPVPSTKPFYNGFRSGADGTIWVFRNDVSREVKNPDWDAARPDNGFPSQWMAHTVADVFDAQGRYLGAVRMPDAVYGGSGVVSADRLWAIGQHTDGFMQVIRYRLKPASGR